MASTGTLDPPEALAPFHPVVRDWFTRAFAAPTPAQAQGWPAIAAGDSALILAPTGSGKTLAAFLWGLDRLIRSRLEGNEAERLLYISPLKALNYDVERNLRGPLAGLAASAERLGVELPEISVGVRTGDTPQSDRQKMIRKPPDILITTPESLYLLLTSRGRRVIEDTRFVIIDEIHSVAATKRGAHLALSMERLEELVAEKHDGEPLQRIGLSATQRPLGEIARFLGGHGPSADPRPVTIVDAGAGKKLELEVVVPVEDMADLGGDARETPLPEPIAGAESQTTSIWPAMYPALLKLVREHTSTLIFVNNRRSSERLALRLNELAEEEVARAHHGSLAREQRTLIEEDLKAGRIPALVATSSLELGIDMGAIDLVIQVESPRSVARGLQRVGRAGHQVGAPSRGRIFPKYRGDLLECAAVVARMQESAIEETRVPRLPLDVLAQQIVAMSAEASWAVDDLHALVRRSYPFTELSREQLEGVLDMLAGRYPSDEFAELRPRIVWDRVADVVRGRDGARSLAVQNAGTIPDRGLYGVFLADEKTRVGELDEEMVYEARTGQTFLLGASAWRIEDITRDRVIVSPAPGAPAAVPFWRGEGPGRPYELGVAVGRTARELAALPASEAEARLAAESAFDERAARNLVEYLAEQARATGTLPSDRAIVVERFRDEIGDWRLCVLTPFGARLHAPWALAIQARFREQTGGEIHAIWSDDGIALHMPDADRAPPADIALIEAEELEELVTGELANTALFGARFRENAARALLIPRRRPGQRTPLWQQRLKSSALLQVARRFGSFPVILETYRECLNDWFDLPALRRLLTEIASRETAVVEVETETASPFAGALLFEYVASYMYEDDTPVAERRAQALSLNRDLLRELLGQEELRELIDAGALEEVEADLQGLSERAGARGADGLHDLLRRIGDLTEGEVAERLSGDGDAANVLAALASERRACVVRVAGEERWIAAEDAGLYRDALGVMPPGGLPAAFLEPAPDALAALARRWSRAHGPFRTDEVADRLGLTSGEADAVLGTLETAGVLVRGEMRPGGSGREWCDSGVLRRLRRASLAALRKEIEPAEPATLGRFLPEWQRVDTPLGRGVDALRDVLGPLQGLPLPAAQWEEDLLPRRVRDYSPRLLDELAAAGEVVWVGAGSGAGGRVALYFREDAALLGPPPAADPPEDEAAAAMRAALGGGAQFWEQLLQASGLEREDAFAALWGLVWAGEATNDLFSPLRAPRRLPAARAASGRFGSRRGAGRGAPSAVAGRWSLAADLFSPAPPEAERRRAWAELLLERHGVLTRPAVLSEGYPGGFAALYPALGDLETLGKCRRGYFVAGLGGAQFAIPGAVERLRETDPARDGTEGRALVIGAADPAQPWGASVPWPARRDGRGAKRIAGSQVVLLDGEAVLYLERGLRSAIALREPEADWLQAAAAALVAWAEADRGRRPRIERFDGEPAIGSTAEAPFIAAGFVSDLRGLVLRS